MLSCDPIYAACFMANGCETELYDLSPLYTVQKQTRNLAEEVETLI